MSFPWLIFHNVSVKKVRSALTAFAVAVGVMTVVALGVVTESVRTTAAGVLQVGAADFTVAQKNVSDILQSSLTDAQLGRVAAVRGVRSAVGVLLDTEKLDNDHPLLVEIGIRPEDLTPFGVRVVAGRPFTGTAANEVLLGSRLAADLNARIGQTIDIAGGPKKVVGIYSTGNVFGDSATMFPLVPFQAFERQPGGLSLLFVKVDPNAKADVAAVEQRVADSSPVLAPIRNLVEFGRADRDYQLITAADRAATIVAIAIGAIIVMNTMLLSLVERYREFGILPRDRMVAPARHRARARRGAHDRARRRGDRPRHRLCPRPRARPAARPGGHPATHLRRGSVRARLVHCRRGGVPRRAVSRTARGAPRATGGHTP